MTLWHYLLLVNVYLILFFGFFTLFLRKETFFQLNRVYLVSGAILSFMIPLIQSQWIKDLFITKQVQQTFYVVNPGIIYNLKPIEHHPATIGNILAWVYCSVSIVLILRLVLRLISLKKIVKQAEAKAAFSFFNKIRVDHTLPSQQTILKHEEVHAKQWHSADILFIELVMIINWFNPVVYFYRKAIKHVHEFIADKKALQSGTTKTEYAMLLLSQTFGTGTHQLTNNFLNQSLLKQRILMLHKSESKRRALLKYGLSAPLFGMMLILSSATVNNNKLTKAIYKNAQHFFLINTNVIVRHGANLQTFKDTSFFKHTIKFDVSATSGDATLPTATKPVRVLVSSEMPANFPGGEAAFLKLLHDKMNYTTEADGKTTGGTITEGSPALINFMMAHHGPVKGTLKDSVVFVKTIIYDTLSKHQFPPEIDDLLQKKIALARAEPGSKTIMFVNGERMSSVAGLDPKIIKSIQVFSHYTDKDNARDTSKKSVLVIRLKKDIEDLN